jgi:hypothetical protein
MAQTLWQRLGCCLTGHDYSVRSDQTRMFLRCNTCGHTSRGAALSDDPCRKRPSAERTASSDGRPQDRPTRLAAR